jgi:hypothetical protein
MLAAGKKQDLVQIAYDEYGFKVTGAETKEQLVNMIMTVQDEIEREDAANDEAMRASAPNKPVSSESTLSVNNTLGILALAAGIDARNSSSLTRRRGRTRRINWLNCSVQLKYQLTSSASVSWSNHPYDESNSVAVLPQTCKSVRVADEVNLKLRSHQLQCRKYCCISRGMSEGNAPGQPEDVDVIHHASGRAVVCRGATPSISGDSLVCRH